MSLFMRERKGEERGLSPLSPTTSCPSAPLLPRQPKLPESTAPASTTLYPIGKVPMGGRHSHSCGAQWLQEVHAGKAPLLTRRKGPFPGEALAKAYI